MNLSAKTNRFEHLGHKINNKKEMANTKTSTQPHGLQTPFGQPAGQWLRR